MAQSPDITSWLKRRTVAGSAALLSVVLLLAGCSEAPSSATGKTVTLGMITATQGDLATLGEGFLKGAELAVKQINQSGFLGAGHTLALETKEGSEDPQKSISALNQLTSDQNVSGVVCCIISPVGGALKPLAQAKKTPLIIYAATLAGLNQPPYVYRTYLLPQSYAPRLSQSVVETYKPKSIAYAVTADNDGMVALLKEIRKPYDTAGVKDLGTVEILAAQTDMHGPAATLASKKADVIQLQMAGNNAGTLVADLRNLGYKGQIVGSAQIGTKGTLTASGNALQGVPFPIDYVPASSAEMAQKFTKAFEAEYGSTPDGWAASGYTSIRFAAQGAKDLIAKGENVTRESLARALSSVTRFPSVYGDTHMQGGQITSDSAGVFGAWSADQKLVLWQP